MNDIIDNQREAGEISGIIPSSGWGYGEWPGPVWDAVMFIIPNALYDYYGESRSIERLYPTMLRYLDYLKTKEKDGYLPFGLGDWVYWNATTNNEYTSTAYYYMDYKLKMCIRDSGTYHPTSGRSRMGGRYVSHALWGD